MQPKLITRDIATGYYLCGIIRVVKEPYIMPKDKEQWAKSGDWTMDIINMNKHSQALM